MTDVSVIIPVFNAESYLAEAIESVIDSDIFPRCEILLIDDGSSDASAEIGMSYQTRYPNISLHAFPNGGSATARNRGIRLAKGEYLFFLDSDDAVAPDYIGALLDRIRSTNSDAALAGFSRMISPGIPVEQEPRSVLDTEEIFTGCGFLNRRMDAGDWNNYVWCAMYRRQFLEEYNLSFCDGTGLYEDILFSNKILLFAHRVCTLADYGYYYRVRSESLAQGAVTVRDVEASLDVLEIMAGEYPSYSAEQRKVLGRVLFQFLSMTLFYIGTVNPPDRRKYFSRLSCLHLRRHLLRSAVTNKEKAKWILFCINWGLYYPIVMK